MEFGIFPENLLYFSGTPSIAQVWIFYCETILTFGAQRLRFRSMDVMIGVYNLPTHKYLIPSVLSQLTCV